jgi:hypothetical protein
LSGPKRYAHFLSEVTDHEELWSLRSTDGWVRGSDDDGRTLIPVWPHRRFAEACAVGPWQAAVPTIIPLERWLAELTPQLVGDGRHVAVFPTPQAEGVAVSPEMLRDEILSKWSPSE